MLSSLIKNRPLCIALTTGSLTYLAFSLLGISLMQCPVNELLHVRCPGCGLTHAVMALLHGDFMTSVHLHAFAIPLLLLFTLIGVSCFLPTRLITTLSDLIAKSERTTYWPHILFVSLIVYSLTRETLTI